MSATSSLVSLSESISPGFSLRNFGASLLALASVAYGLIHIILPPVRNETCHGRPCEKRLLEVIGEDVMEEIKRRDSAGPPSVLVA